MVEQPLGRRSSALGIELGPQGDALAGVGVDEHHRRVVGERGVEVGPLRQVRGLGVEAGHM
jgi:hypothetical protein